MSDRRERPTTGGVMGEARGQEGSQSDGSQGGSRVNREAVRFPSVSPIEHLPESPANTPERDQDKPSGWGSGQEGDALNQTLRETLRLLEVWLLRQDQQGRVTGHPCVVNTGLVPTDSHREGMRRPPVCWRRSRP